MTKLSELKKGELFSIIENNFGRIICCKGDLYDGEEEEDDDYKIEKKYVVSILFQMVDNVGYKTATFFVESFNKC